MHADMIGGYPIAGDNKAFLPDLVGRKSQRLTQ